jgi:dienelactone hydrolase
MSKSLTLALALALFATAAVAEPEHRTLRRPNGSEIDWYLDRQAPPKRQGLLVLAQGSGCGSVTTNPNIEMAKSLRPDFAVLTVEKYGVAPGARQKDPEDCSAAFWQNHTVSQRVQDYSAVIASLKAEPWWNGQLVLFGGSEGGAVVQILAAEVDASATIIFSSATGVPFREAFVQVLPPPVASEARARLDAARQNPLSAERWGGNSYRWWADIADRPLWRDALKAHGDLLVVQGALDGSNPVSSARAFRDAFAAQGRANLTYWEYPDYDHTMIDSAGASHLAEVFARIADWLDQRLGVSAAKRAGS